MDEQTKEHVGKLAKAMVDLLAITSSRENLRATMRGIEKLDLSKRKNPIKEEEERQIVLKAFRNKLGEQPIKKKAG